MKNREVRLTEREIEIINLLTQGLSRKMIAASLKISLYTVDSHLQHLRSKTQTSSLPELISFSYKALILEL